MANHPFPDSPGIVRGPTNVPPCFLAILSRRIPSRFVTFAVTPNMYSLMVCILLLLNGFCQHRKAHGQPKEGKQGEAQGD